jgi:eukaryotic-like serine/threonine-protein kinase
MTLSAGTRLGPYEILAPLGAGGMGEVYRARDPRLGREVAIKVLPESFSKDADRLRRFEREARSASALNHPNIITVHDIGSSDSIFYIAMEFVDGQSLRQLLASGPVPTKKLLDIGVQIAEGLAKAHAAGIVHRDLKPENVMVSKDGFVKLLDFGLAKLFVAPIEQVSGAPTAVQQETQPGTVMGTVGYMSPEQASGRPVDFRSDQFSLGSILYEMTTGKRAFQKSTGAETLSAIIRDEPDPVERVNPQTPAPLRWIVERCLAKDPEERYASTKDLARELKSIRDHLSQASVASDLGLAAFAPSRRRPRALAAAALAIVGALLVAAFLLGQRSGVRPVPRYDQVTFRRGTVWTARYSSDGHTILYGASFEGSPVEIFEKREGSFESRPLGLPGSNLLSISRTGPLAISLRNRLATAFLQRGTLAELAPGGTSAPRELLDEVYAADWAPDGSSLAVVREIGGRFQLEYPIGKVLYQTAGWISHARVSPDGERVAFLDHPIPNDDGGSVSVVDRSGRRKTLAPGFQSEEGLAWSPDSREVWFTGARSGTNLSLFSVTLSGRITLIDRVPGFFLIQDISRDRRVLASRESWRIGLFGRIPGEERERDLSWLDWSLAADMSRDGKMILFTEAGEGGGAGYSTYMRRTDETGAVRLGEGFAQSFSADGRSVVAIVQPSGEAQVVIYPTGVGERRQLPREGLTPQRVDWMPDGRQLLVSANERGKGVRLWFVDAESGKARPISPEGFRQFSRCISNEGSRTIASGPDQRLYLYPLRGGEPSPLPGLTTEDQPSGWTPDGHSFFVFRRNELPAKIYRYDTVTGRKQLWKEISLPDPTGIIQVNRFISTPDGGVYVYNYQRYLSELYEVEGLR